MVFVMKSYRNAPPRALFAMLALFTAGCSTVSPATDRVFVERINEEARRHDAMVDRQELAGRSRDHPDMVSSRMRQAAERGNAAQEQVSRCGYHGGMASKQPVSPQQVGEVAASIAAMTLSQKERVIDELFSAQPTLLGNAAVVTRLPVPAAIQDAVIETALVVFICLRDELSQPPMMTEAILERCCQRNVQMWKFLDGEAGESFTRSVATTLAAYPEPSLLAYAVNRLTELQVQEPRVMLLVKSGLDAAISAKWGHA